ncbi:MAG TPA: M20/M25/M40 family metallo-hydrolase [Thermomicrobiales bacterium]|nr:M20/M25/M40 family metallo-hydrolase [Thermomicrobiales bacterium]
MTHDLSDVYTYIDEHKDDYIRQLQEMLQQPSIAAQALGMEEMANKVGDDLKALGAEPRQIDTRGGFPVVYAELPGKANRTLSFYDHYDVQPADPLDQWASDPWSGEVRDGRIWARGVADNKGNIAARFAAIDAWQKVRGELPLNVKFIIEGEEEIGSPHLQNFVDDHPDLCQADACIWEFGGRDIDGRPQIHLGLKGICYVELRVKGARSDWHSAAATSVPNPAWRLVWALATLKGPDDRILIPGFYDKCVPPTEAELTAMANLPDLEQERLEDLGIDRFINGLTGMDLHLKDLFEPTCTISGLLSGYTEKGQKTVLPGTAMAKIDMRLVANQDPHEIYALLRKHLDDNGFTDIESELIGAGYPARTSLEAPIAKVVAETFEELYGEAPAIFPTNPGSGPWYQLCDALGIDACTAGVGHGRSQAHAPNENIYVDDFILGIKHIAAIMDRYAASGE